MLAAGRSETLTYGPEGERRGEGMRVFVQAFAPRPRMLVFGAIDFAAAVARMGSFLGYDVTVCDARPVFATRSRFKDADRVVVEWPHRYLAAEAAAGRIDRGRVYLGNVAGWNGFRLDSPATGPHTRGGSSHAPLDPAAAASLARRLQAGGAPVPAPQASLPLLADGGVDLGEGDHLARRLRCRPSRRWSSASARAW